MSTLMVHRNLVVANTYNPNSVSPDKMDLLRTSIIDNGWCFPIVTIWDSELRQFVIVDGFHRNLIGSKEWLDVDYIPIVVLSHSMSQRMAATIQFNKARGVHQVDLDADVVRALIQQGMSDEEVASKLGMELDSVHRYKQLTGIAELFKGVQYSTAWEMVDDDAD
jgi:ParB-like chromosome segregation protein Spo0J